MKGKLCLTAIKVLEGKHCLSAQMYTEPPDEYKQTKKYLSKNQLSKDKRLLTMPLS